LDEARDAVAEGVDLEQKADLQALAAQGGQAIQDRLPVLVAGEVVVGDEEARDALAGVRAHDRLDVIGGAEARLAALDIDGGAEASLEGTASSGIEARIMAGDPGYDASRQQRQSGGLHAGQIAEMIVDRLQPSCGDVLQ